VYEGDLDACYDAANQALDERKLKKEAYVLEKSKEKFVATKKGSDSRTACFKVREFKFSPNQFGRGVL